MIEVILGACVLGLLSVPPYFIGQWVMRHEYSSDWIECFLMGWFYQLAGISILFVLALIGQAVRTVLGI